ncbi:MAG: hypothetical protein JSS49_03790 [Planctomycetes bacterium]|nr:hypothetical protein [Planctomycetota bacterium]
MTSIFTACALFGGTLLICQTIMTLVGLSGDHDFGGDTDADLDDLDGADGDHSLETHDHGAHHHSSTWFFGIVTFRTIVAATTFFGLAGMASLSNQISEGPSLLIASLAGLAAMYIVHWLMQQLRRLRADGSVRIERAVGLTGNVYLRVPGAHQGAGKIVLNLQNRTVELTAWTDQSELPTGSTIVVTRVIGPDSVEVSAASAKV